MHPQTSQGGTLYRHAAIAVAALLALTACGGGNGSNTADKSAKKPTSAPAKKAPKKPPTLALGKSARTEGTQNPVEGPGGGTMQITPTTVVYSAKGTGEKPKEKEFAVVTLREKPLTDKPVAESAPIEGGGWKWIAPNGQSIDEGNGNAFNVTPETYTGGGMIQPGSWAWDTAAFDLTEGQRGGTLVYTDGGGNTYRWTMPDKDTGPDVGKLKKELDW